MGLMEIPSQAARVAAVQQLGYTSREAEFLVLAALHSGAFMARHWAFFIGRTNGYQRHMFTRKLIKNRDARQFPSTNRTLIYQIGKRIFSTLSEADNKNRRLPDDSLTKRRMMCLDYVLRHPQWCRYLATEAEKWNYFHHTLGISATVLPGHEYASRSQAGSTKRFFLNKFPIVPQPAGAVFIYAYSDGSKASFETFLSHHRPLFAALENATLIFVTGSETAALQAQRILDRSRRGMADAALEFVDLEIQFRELQALESRGPAQLSVPELKRLRELRSAKNSELFPQWLADGLATLRAETERNTSAVDLSRVAFQPCILELDFSFLGAL